MSIEEAPGDFDAVFILASALTIQGHLQESYDQLNAALALGQGRIPDGIYLLHAHMCARLHSNTVSLLPQAISDFDYLIAQHPEDMNFVSAGLQPPVSVHQSAVGDPAGSA